MVALVTAQLSELLAVSVAVGAAVSLMTVVVAVAEQPLAVTVTLNGPAVETVASFVLPICVAPKLKAYVYPAPVLAVRVALCTEQFSELLLAKVAVG